MKANVIIPIVMFLSLGGGSTLVAAPFQEQTADERAQAEKWIAQADSTRALVAGVLQSAVEAGAETHAVAKDQVADARHWMTEGEKALKSAREAVATDDYEKGATQGNMAWQYYVKAGTAAVLAARLVSGGS